MDRPARRAVRPAPGADPVTRLRLASYNIRKAVGLDWRRDPARIVAVANTLRADVLVLQEADLRLGPRPGAIPRSLIERETDYEIVDVALGWQCDPGAPRSSRDRDAAP